MTGITAYCLAYATEHLRLQVLVPDFGAIEILLLVLVLLLVLDRRGVKGREGKRKGGVGCGARMLAGTRGHALAKAGPGACSNGSASLRLVASTMIHVWLLF